MDADEGNLQVVIDVDVIPENYHIYRANQL